MTESFLAVLPPGGLLILGPLLLLVLRGSRLQLAILALPILSFWHLQQFPIGYEQQFELFEATLTPIRVDKLSLVWGTVYHIAAFLSMLYMLHVKDKLQHITGLMYAGSAIAAAFAGDLVTLFVFWELTAITSVFLIWAGRSERSFRVGSRYLILQVASGVILLAGVILRYEETQDLAFGAMSLGSQGGALIFLAFGIKCAFPLLHNWLQDSYPEASPGGSVILSAFTTKLAVYALARSFAGEEILIPIGAAMTLFPIIFAVIENDLRRVLAYSLNNQLGFMVVAIGIGTPLAINGAAAHAFAHIIYKGLLFMSMGAVLHRTGTVKATELGGLYKSMPWTTAFCIIGSLSISGFPLFSGFVTKSMSLTAAADTHLVWLTVVLLIASAGVVDHSGIKIPFFAFFAHDSGKRVQEAPLNMLMAMGGAAVLCIGVGIYPDPLYALLPYPVDYAPYTGSHVLTSLQLLLFAALAFSMMWQLHLRPRRGAWPLLTYPPELRQINLDTDWLYRRALPTVGRVLGVPLLRLWVALRDGLYSGAAQLARGVGSLSRPPALLGEPWTAGTTSLWAILFLGVCLVLSFLNPLLGH